MISKNHNDAHEDTHKAVNSTTPSATAPTISSLVGVVPEKLLDEGEIVILAIKPSLWSILFNSTKVLVALVVLVALASYLPTSAFDRIGVSMTTACQIVVVLMILQLTVAFLQWLSRVYVLTNRRVMRIQGVLNVEVFEAPLLKIQNTFITLAIHERVFRLGSIHFATAGTGLLEATWMNVNSPLETHEIVRNAIRHAQSGTNNGL